MTREIKFRAWNKDYGDDEERMMYDVWLTPKGEVIMPDGEYYDYPVMQYTGLKDKNGTDVYEGDILGYGNAKCEVGWNPNLAKFTIVRWIYGAGSKQIKFISEKFEVIGNIYSNPELLS